MTEDATISRITLLSNSVELLFPDCDYVLTLRSSNGAFAGASSITDVDGIKSMLTAAMDTMGNEENIIVKHQSS